jgi:hypothetical protein
MGAYTFTTFAEGKTAKEAFADAVNDARYEHGNDGYTGTIAEKHNFKLIAFPDYIDITKANPVDATHFALKYAETLIENNDKRISDKWGPAGCLDLKNGKFLFFGWASS